jgi:hypothetical protein
MATDATPDDDTVRPEPVFPIILSLSKEEPFDRSTGSRLRANGIAIVSR